MGNRNRSFLNKPSFWGIGIIAALRALVVINSLFAGGQIDCGDHNKDHIQIFDNP